VYYINSFPTENGNYGNPGSRGDIILPDEYLTGYLEAMGFVNISVEDGTVTAMEVNEEALEAYLASLPDEPDEPDEPDDGDADVNDILNVLLGVIE